MSYKCTYRFIFCLLSGLPVSFNWVVCNNPVLSAFLNWNWSLSYTAGRPRYSAHISRCVSSWAVTSGLHKHNSSIITHRNRIFWNCFCCLYQHLNYCFYFFLNLLPLLPDFKNIWSTHLKASQHVSASENLLFSLSSPTLIFCTLA